jgi:hypothetical protein
MDEEEDDDSVRLWFIWYIIQANPFALVNKHQ